MEQITIIDKIRMQEAAYIREDDFKREKDLYKFIRSIMYDSVFAENADNRDFYAHTITDLLEQDFKLPKLLRLLRLPTQK